MITITVILLYCMYLFCKACLRYVASVEKSQGYKHKNGYRKYD